MEKFLVGCDDGSNKDFFRDNLRCFLCNGSEADFWSCIWLCSQSIKEAYPELFTYYVLQFSSVVGMGEWIDGVWKWNLHLNERNLDNDATCLKDELLEKLEMF